MILYENLSTNMINVYIFALILVCPLYFWSILVSINLKKYRVTVLSIILGFLSWMGMLIAREGRVESEPFYLTPLLELSKRIPFECWIIYLVVLAVIAVFLIIRNWQWQKNNISPASIKDCADGHPAGIAFWNENGRLLFTNTTISRICREMTGKALLNGHEFLAKAGDGPIVLPDNSVWDVFHRQLEVDGEIVHEMIIHDITEHYEKSKALERDTAKLQKLNRELDEYNAKLPELVKQQEILNAKIRIHDNMNILLTATGRAFDDGDIAKQDELLNNWKNNIALLAGENKSKAADNILEDLKTYGGLIGVEFDCDEIPSLDNQEKMRFFVRCSREAMSNAAKHGNAKHVFADIQETTDVVEITFTNDGACITKDAIIKPSGGLLVLEETSEKLGGNLRVEAKDKFKLIITIPKGEKL